MSVLSYNPGVLPSKPAPRQGESIELTVAGYPPWKDEHFSIRNSKHKIHTRFLKLREAATAAMAGRAWIAGAVSMELELSAPAFELGKALIDYVAGIEDTVDGSSGCTFTYLPIVVEDDCQIYQCSARLLVSAEVSYRVVFTAH